MKPQDILFLLVLAALLYKHNPKHFAIAGLLCIVLAAPLFGLQIFFTAQRFTYYSAAFFLIAVILYMVSQAKERK